MRKLFILLFIFISVQIFAQNPSLEFKAKYEQAKIDLKNKDYKNANSKLLLLKNGTVYPSYSTYINYFLAQSYFYLNNWEQAENELITLQKSKPNWAKINDLNFLLGKIYLKTNRFENALSSFNKIANKAFENDIKTEVNQFLQNRKPIIWPSNWLDKNPNLSFLNSLAKNKNVAQIYDIKESELPYLPERTKVNYSDNNYNVGLLFPFKIDSNKTENNQYIYDFYEGMKMAKEKLQNESINVNIHTYNVGNTTNEILKLLKNRPFLEEEILIGPLYNEPNKIAQYYANERKVILVNPMSKNSHLVNNKPFSLLNKAGNAGFAKQATKFLTFNFIGEIAVIHDKNDTSLVKVITNELKKSNTKFSLISYNNGESLNSFSKKKFGSILLLSSAKTSLNIISSINQKWNLTPILIHKDNLPTENFSKLQDAELYIFNQDFINEEAEQIQQFRTEYWEKRSNLASIYTMKGYDMLLFWGRQMHKFKQNLPNMFNILNSDEGYLVNNFNYSLVPNENSAFTITTIQNGIETLYRKF